MGLLMDNKTIKVRHGIPMDAESLEAWKNAFIEIEESIEQLDLKEGQKNPYSRYLRMKQQTLF